MATVDFFKDIVRCRLVLRTDGDHALAEVLASHREIQEIVLEHAARASSQYVSVQNSTITCFLQLRVLEHDVENMFEPPGDCLVGPT